MQLVELSLYNFCLYKGEQVFNLGPDRRHGKPKPIVLIGGINGGGKTTFFDAILLALYGSRAKCSKRVNRSYKEFLADCISRGVDPADGSSITLTFRYVSEGMERLYEVRRRWAVKRGSLRENVTVYRDGERDTWLSANWSHVVEEIIPLGISQLFFFDAEKIRFIAEDESTSEALGAAIKSMLGLDLVERVIADTKVVEMRLAETHTRSEDLAEINECKKALAELTDARQGLKQTRAGIENEVEQAQERLRKAEAAFAGVGGEHWEKRKHTEQKERDLLVEQRSLEATLITFASGELPLGLVPDLLEFIARQDTIERECNRFSLMEEVLSDHHHAIIASLKKKKLRATTIKAVQGALDETKSSLEHPADPEVAFCLSHRSRDQLCAMLSSTLESQRNIAREQLTDLETTLTSLDSVRRSLAVVPKEADIKAVSEELKQAIKEVSDAESRASRLDKEIEENKRECFTIEKRIEDKLLKHESEVAGAEEATRMSRLAARSRDTMQLFLERSTKSKIDRLAEHIFESFQYLLRKKTLVASVHIDPKNFSMQLLDSNGCTVPKQRLSEGEKQILAIAVLWGLGRASHRRLPAIIDTPMARLDAAHRENLLTRYFPSASHQTIILSTDTEVDEQYFRMLEPHVARAYLLKYSERKQVTTVEEGYFWEHENLAAVQS